MNETQNTNAGATANAYPGNNPPPGEFQNFGSTIPPKGPKKKRAPDRRGNPCDPCTDHRHNPLPEA